MAGVIAAKANNSVCTVGIAHGAKFGSIKIPNGVIEDSVQTRAISFNSNYTDIYVLSWNPDENGTTPYNLTWPGPEVKEALENGALYGRNGKGSVFILASGEKYH